MSQPSLMFVDSSTGLPASGKWRETIAFVDIDGDGCMDILAPRPRLATAENDRPIAWMGNCKGQWQKAFLGVPDDLRYDYGGIVALDFDGDGVLDIALAMHGLGLRALRGEGQGVFRDQSDGFPPVEAFPTRALCSADFDRSGKDEVVAVSEILGRGAAGQGLQICSWLGEAWSCRALGDQDQMHTLFADWITTGDVNGDGNPDIAVASLQHRRSLIVWLGDGDGNFVPYNEGLPRDIHYPWVSLFDVDGDGRDDLVAAISGFGADGVRGLRVYLSRGTGFEDYSAGLPDDEVFFSVAACDFEGDGTPEIVGGTASGGLRVFALRGDVWSEIMETGLPSNGLERIYGVYCVDVNHDGHPDIVLNYSRDGDNQEGGIRVFLHVPQEKKG